MQKAGSLDIKDSDIFGLLLPVPTEYIFSEIPVVCLSESFYTYM